MKILSMLASPNKNGNTSLLLEEYIKGVRESHAEAEISEVFLHQKDIQACRGCNGCKRLDNKQCVIEDDMQPYYQDVEEANVLLFATPVYWYNMTAQLKTFIDRLYAMDFNNFPANKKLVLLSTYGATEQKSSGYSNILNSLQSACNILGIELVHELGVSSSVPLSEQPEVLAEAYQLGRSL